MRIADAQWIPSTPHQTWDALHDPAVLQRCLPGCVNLQRLTPTEYAITVHSRVGDVEADYQGEILLSDLEAPRRFSLAFEGKGESAGMAIGTAQITLSPKDDGTRLGYTVAAMAGGKLAEKNGDLLAKAGGAIVEKFFDGFIAHMAQVPRTAAPPPAPGAEPQERGLANSRWSWVVVLAVLVLIVGYHAFR